VLQAAVFTDRRLRLRHRSSGRGEPEASRPEAERAASERVVDPYGLVCKAGIWYLVADQDGSRGCCGCHG
jgi:predicted DNA-binding transcriptional regulator YafY